MDNHSQLKAIFVTTKFTTDWHRYTVVFRYIMQTIKGLTVIEEKEVRAQFH